MNVVCLGDCVSAVVKRLLEMLFYIVVNDMYGVSGNESNVEFKALLGEFHDHAHVEVLNACRFHFHMFFTCLLTNILGCLRVILTHCVDAYIFRNIPGIAGGCWSSRSRAGANR